MASIIADITKTSTVDLSSAGLSFEFALDGQLPAASPPDVSVVTRADQCGLLSTTSCMNSEQCNLVNGICTRQVDGSASHYDATRSAYQQVYSGMPRPVITQEPAQPRGGDGVLYVHRRGSKHSRKKGSRKKSSRRGSRKR